MRDQILVDRHRLQTLEREVQELAAKLSDAFSVEEMDAIREQLVARVADAEGAREELEWNLRMEMARVREVEASCIRAAHEMREVAGSLARLLGEEEAVVTTVRKTPRRRMFA